MTSSSGSPWRCVRARASVACAPHAHCAAVLCAQEFVIDGLFCLFLFAAGVAVAQRCSEKLSNTDIYRCSEAKDRPQVAAVRCVRAPLARARWHERAPVVCAQAFSFLAFFLFCGSAFFSFMRWRSS